MKMKVIIFLKRYWLIVLLAFLATLVIFIKFFFARNQPPTGEPGPSPTAIPTLEIEGTRLSGSLTTSFSSFPKLEKAYIYRGTARTILTNSAGEIAQIFGFTGSPLVSRDTILGDINSWSSNEKYLIVGLETSKIIYGKNLLNQSAPQTGSLPSKQEAEESLKNLYQKISLSPEISFFLPLPEKYLLARGTLFEPTTQDKADFLQVGFSLQLNNFPFLSKDPNKPLVSLIVDKNKETVTYEDLIIFSRFTPTEEFSLKTESEVKNTLLGEGKIVSLGITQEDFFNLKFKRGNLNKISLVYLQPTLPDQLIQPVFLLEGEITLLDEQTVPVAIYLPAFSKQSQP